MNNPIKIINYLIKAFFFRPQCFHHQKCFAEDQFFQFIYEKLQKNIYIYTHIYNNAFILTKKTSSYKISNNIINYRKTNHRLHNKNYIYNAFTTITYIQPILIITIH